MAILTDQINVKRRAQLSWFLSLLGSIFICAIFAAWIWTQLLFENSEIGAFMAGKVCR